MNILIIVSDIVPLLYGSYTNTLIIPLEIVDEP